MNELDKLQVLLPHWIEHQAEHARELQEWAERTQLAGQKDVAEKLLVAATALQQAGDYLSDLLNQVGEMTKNGEKT